MRASIAINYALRGEPTYDLGLEVSILSNIATNHPARRRAFVDGGKDSMLVPMMAPPNSAGHT